MLCSICLGRSTTDAFFCIHCGAVLAREHDTTPLIDDTCPGAATLEEALAELRQTVRYWLEEVWA